MGSRRRWTEPSQTYGEDSSQFISKTAWHRYQENVHLWNILPERNVEFAPGMYDEFYSELHRRYWHRRLTRLPEKKIDVALLKEFYSNVYDLEDGLPNTCNRSREDDSIRCGDVERVLGDASHHCRRGVADHVRPVPLLLPRLWDHHGQAVHP